jgi:hypothetical protein
MTKLKRKVNTLFKRQVKKLGFSETKCLIKSERKHKRFSHKWSREVGIEVNIDN